MIKWRYRSVMRRLVTFIYVSLILLHLLLSVCQAEVITLPLRRATGLEISHHDNGGRERRAMEAVEQPMEGISGEGYYIDVNMGTPHQQMQILVDTGSSNFAVAAGPDPHISHYFNSSGSGTYEDTLDKIYVPYTQGEWEGILGTDNVTLTSLPNVTFRPNIAFIQHSRGFFIPESSWQGIVGFAYQSIARPDTLTPFWDTLRDAADIEDIFSMQLCGTAHSHNASAEPALEGTLVLGGVQEDLYQGDIFYSPIVKEMYYEVVISDIAVDSKSLGLECKEYNFDKTIVDSGTTHLRLPARVFQAVVKHIKNFLEKQPAVSMPEETFWTGEDLLCWDDLTQAIDLFPAISLSLVSSEGHNQFFTLPLTAQHYLRSVEDVNVGVFGPRRTCLKFGISSSDSGTVLGALLMESFFVVFDRQNKRIGFAETTCPPPYPGSLPSDQAIRGVRSSKANLTACHYQRATQDESTLLVVTYIMAAVCVVCSLPLIIVVIQWQLRKIANRRGNVQDPEAETVLTDNK